MLIKLFLHIYFNIWTIYIGISFSFQTQTMFQNTQTDMHSLLVKCSLKVSIVWQWMLTTHSMSKGYYASPDVEVGVYDLNGIFIINIIIEK